MKISPAISINKKCHSHQWFPAFKCEGGLPKLGSSGCCQPHLWLLRSWGDARSKVSKETGFAPDSWGACERNGFSEPRGLHLPIHRMLNSLTWYLIFDVQTVCKLVYSLTSPPVSLEQFSQIHWDAISQARVIPTKQNNSLLSGCNSVFLVVRAVTHCVPGNVLKRCVILSFNLLNNSKSFLLLFPPSLQSWGNWGPELCA